MSSFTTAKGAPAFRRWVANGLPPGVWGIGGRDVRCGEIPSHQALDGADTQRGGGLEGTRKDISQVRRLEPTPLAQRVLDIRGEIPHPIDRPLPVVDADGPGLAIDGGPREGAAFPDPEPAAQHQQKHGAIVERINDLDKVEQIRFRHRFWEGVGHEGLMSAPIDGLMRELPRLLQEGKEAMQGVQDIVDGGGGETAVVGHGKPRIDLVRRGRRDVPTDPRLVCRRQAHAEGLERADRGLDRLGGIMAGLQHREVVRHDFPARLTHKLSPPEGGAVMERIHACLLLQRFCRSLRS
jgi:hypothetical protein